MSDAQSGTPLHNSPAELEVRRIARLVNVDPGELEALHAIGAEDLRVVRGQIVAKLFDEHTESWERAVAVTGVVPTGLAAKLSEKALGPVLSARVTGLLSPDKAVDVGSKLSPAFMADIAVNVDPRKVTDLVVAMPPQTIAAVARELAARGEWLVMADFVAAVTTPALRTTVDAVDDRAVLQIAPLLEDPERVRLVISLLDDERLAGLRETAEQEGLTAHLEHVAQQLDEAERHRVTG